MDEKPEDLLDRVGDRDSFIAFVRALAAERDRAAEIERDNPQAYVVDGALDWKNADIGPYLFACLDYFEDKPSRTPNRELSWRMFAEFLYLGKIIE